MKRVGDARPGNVDSLPYISKVAIESLGKGPQPKPGAAFNLALSHSASVPMTIGIGLIVIK